MDISAQRMMVSKEQVLAILLMRFHIQPSKATLIVQKWFTQHPAETWETLKTLLNQNQVIVSEGLLKGGPKSSSPESHTPKYRGVEYPKASQPLSQLKDNNSRTKGRTYRGIKY